MGAQTKLVNWLQKVDDVGAGWRYLCGDSLYYVILKFMTKQKSTNTYYGTISINSYLAYIVWPNCRAFRQSNFNQRAKLLCIVCCVGQTTPNKTWRSLFRICRLPLVWRNTFFSGGLWALKAWTHITTTALSGN